MKIQTKITLLFLSIVTPLILNLVVLLVIATNFRSITVEVQHLFDRQDDIRELVTSLNNAETLIYQYQIDGDLGFANQYRAHSTSSQNEIDTLALQMSAAPLSDWFTQLAVAHENSVETGLELIQLQQQQQQDLDRLQQLTDTLSTTLLEHLQEVESPEQFRAIAGLIQDLYLLDLAVVTHVAAPQTANRTTFTDAAIRWRANFDVVNAESSADNLNAALRYFSEIETIGSQIINDRDRQNLQFATFASDQFFINEQLISNKILPYTNETFLQSQTSLVGQIINQTILSVVVAVLGVGASLAIAVPMLRHLHFSINNLLDGANRVSEGDYSTQVVVNTRDEMQKLAAIFNTMMSELENREQRLQKRISELQILRHKFALVQEEERRLVGLDLHDGLTQMLLSANMHVNTATAFLDDISEQAQAELQMVQQRLKEAIEEVRWVISELRPTELDDYGLVDGVRHYANKVAQNNNWIVTVQMDVPDEIQPAIDPAIETTLFRIVQESLSNARKHSHTPSIDLSMTYEAGNVHAVITDSGIGFDITALSDHALDRLGLLGMQERATAVGGHVEICSQVMQGTTVRVSLPLHVKVKTYD